MSRNMHLHERTTWFARLLIIICVTCVLLGVVLLGVVYVVSRCSATPDETLPAAEAREIDSATCAELADMHYGYFINADSDPVAAVGLDRIDQRRKALSCDPLAETTAVPPLSA